VTIAKAKLLPEYRYEVNVMGVRGHESVTQWTVGEVDFWIFWIFNFLQFAIDAKNNFKTKVEKVFFFIFMSSYAEMSFLK
jgi:hypothetical protein